MFAKLLIANRGEIAVRAIRAAAQLGIRTVAVYPEEDRHGLHRVAADEAVLISEPGRPVQAYLSIEAVVGAAVATGADAIYPGYGFLSENAGLARACAAAGITFVGPAGDVLQLAGSKTAAVTAARAAGLSVLAGSAPATDLDQLVAIASGMRFPVFVKAVAGGGGRGMRLVDEPAGLRSAAEAASREAEAAFGDPAVFLEPAVIRPRHIEVQILADSAGDTVHLFERDCSLQRRHQKVVELAPAPGLAPALRERICSDAVIFARSIGYVGAGTVEFLLAPSGEHFFIEMNPRIQVEHTVTEEITGVDLVQAQLRIAGGETLSDLGLRQDSITMTGAALQCRITTEDPEQDFRPGTGLITAYTAPGGAGVRVDGGSQVGAAVEPHFDSLIAKLTCRGSNRTAAIARSRQALAEFEIAGLPTNVEFLRGVLEHPDFVAGRIHTSWLGEPAQATLLTGAVGSRARRARRLLQYVADVTVNQPHGPAPAGPDVRAKLPPDDPHVPVPAGSRDRLRRLGPEGFAADLRAQKALAVTDTTFRDAHQSLLATRLRTADLLELAGPVARATPQLLSVEAWGGATYDVALRFLHEDPWDRLAQLRAAMPHLCLQMLLRGRNTVGYTPYPPRVTQAFVDEAVDAGIDIFRVFDALNDVDQMRPAIEAIRTKGDTIAEVALCYTGDLSDPAETLYTLDYYLRLAERIVQSGAHILAIKDMAGLLRAPAAARLVSALRSSFDVPVHVHTHDTAGGQLAAYAAAWAAGADAVDGASAALAGTTSQPSLSAIVAAAAHTDRDTGLSLAAVAGLEPAWAALRTLYAPFETSLPAPTGRVYEHEIPGGQLSNLRTQAIALGLGHRFEDVETAYAAADQMLGRLVKVTPSSKVVGDLALHLVGAGVEPAAFALEPGRFDVPDSVIGFLRGELGTPVGGWPEPFRTRALDGRSPAPPESELAEADRVELEAPGEGRRALLNRLLFPGPHREFMRHRATYGDTSALDARTFFYGLRPGVEERLRLAGEEDVLVSLLAVSEVDSRGVRTLAAQVDGRLALVEVQDAGAETLDQVAERADPHDPSHIAAPFTGLVNVTVKPGDRVEAGALVATIEAMKMEAAITTPQAGVVRRVAVTPAHQATGGDLLLIVSAAA